MANWKSFFLASEGDVCRFIVFLSAALVLLFIGNVLIAIHMAGKK